MGWLIALGILTVLAFLPLGLSLRYDDDGFRIFWKVVFFTIPGRKKQKKSPKSTKRKKKSKKGMKGASSASSQSTEKKKGGSLSDFMPFLQVVFDLLDDCRSKLRVRRLEMKLIMAAEDPSDLAVNYGRAWAALGNLIPQLERLFIIKKRDLEVECDFEATQTLIVARIDITITVCRLLCLVMRHGLRGVKEFLNIKKRRKGGAQK